MTQDQARVYLDVDDGHNVMLEYTNEHETKAWLQGEREGPFILVEEFGSNTLGRFARGKMYYPTDQGDQ